MTRTRTLLIEIDFPCDMKMQVPLSREPLGGLTLLQARIHIDLFMVFLSRETGLLCLVRIYGHLTAAMGPGVPMGKTQNLT